MSQDVTTKRRREVPAILDPDLCYQMVLCDNIWGAAREACGYRKGDDSHDQEPDVRAEIRRRKAEFPGRKQAFRKKPPARKKPAALGIYLLATGPRCRGTDPLRCASHVVVAASPRAARLLARCGAECTCRDDGPDCIWRDPERTTCARLGTAARGRVAGVVATVKEGA